MYTVCETCHKKYFDTNIYIYLDLLQIHSTIIGPGLLGPATVMFKGAIRGLMLKISRPLLLFHYNDDHFATLIEK